MIPVQLIFLRLVIVFYQENYDLVSAALLVSYSSQVSIFSRVISELALMHVIKTFNQPLLTKCRRPKEGLSPSKGNSDCLAV